MRQAHWIRGNQQERMPPRMIAFDTESRSSRTGDEETQTWRVGCAIRWRTDLTTGDNAEYRVFDYPEDFWSWVSDYTRKGTRTVVWAHNLSHDVRISYAFTILPLLGFTLEWCNLDANVSSVTWRSEHGTIVMADTWTWLPVSLQALAPMTGLAKFDMPREHADDTAWSAYCMRDCQVVYRIVRELTAYIRDNHLGNWQPTGAGMAYATWRHKFMPDKVLVHDDQGALEAERAAMYAGRAEAWKHGEHYDPAWTEIDMRNAYVTIAAQCDMPRKLHMRHGSITMAQYGRLRERYRVLCRCDVTTDTPVLPYRKDGRILWPVGTFTGWYWDTEVDCALRYGASVKIREAYCYVRSPVLRDWANWILSVVHGPEDAASPIVRTWLKHCSRALIGRLALRTKTWELFGSNPDSITGITHMTDPQDGVTRRLMHVGDKTFIETDPSESENSVPMITGWIMSECRVRLWDAMNATGLEHLAHVDTDSMLVSAAGLASFRQAPAGSLGALWAVKGSWRRVELYGPRAYYRGTQRVMAGIPRRASEDAAGVFHGERWASHSRDLEAIGDGVVTTWYQTWTRKTSDPRRQDRTGAAGDTDAYVVGAGSSENMSSAATAACGS